MVFFPEHFEDCQEVIAFAKTNGMSVGPKGYGCSFNDATVNNGNIIIDLTNLNKIMEFSSNTGVVVVEAGVSIRQLIRKFMPLNFMPPAIPGTLNATIGGLIGNNVHGKDSIVNGNFGRHVDWIDLLVANGNILRVSKSSNKDLFLATVGGFGITGVVLRAAIRLKKIRSSRLQCSDIFTGSFEETCYEMQRNDNVDYMQSWVDSLPTGNKAGRAIVMIAEHIASPIQNQLSDKELEKRLLDNHKFFGLVPAKPIWQAGKPLFYPPLMNIVNWAYWIKRQRPFSNKPKSYTQEFADYYFFHNNIPDFYSVYEPRGFVEIQILLPFESASSGFRQLLETSRSVGVYVTLSGMKRAIEDDFFVSFQGNGLTYSLDIPVFPNTVEALKQKMRPVFDLVCNLGGKVNLSKDILLQSDHFKSMYPNWKRLASTLEAHDPNGLFQNDLKNRLLGD